MQKLSVSLGMMSNSSILDSEKDNRFGSISGNETGILYDESLEIWMEKHGITPIGFEAKKFIALRQDDVIGVFPIDYVGHGSNRIDNHINFDKGVVVNI